MFFRNCVLWEGKRNITILMYVHGYILGTRFTLAKNKGLPSRKTIKRPLRKLREV